MKRITKSNGFSLVESILALAVAMIFLVGVFDMMSVIQETSQNTSLLLEAQIFAKDNLYSADHFLKENFTATTTEEIPLKVPFSGNLKIVDITQCRKEIQSGVEWNTDTSTKTHGVTFSGLVSSLKILKKLGNDCGGNDFLNSISTTTPLPAIREILPFDIKLTGIDIYNKSKFISAISSEEPSPDLIVKYENGNLESFSTLDFGVGVNSLDVASNYVFTAQNSSTSQLAIIDVNNPEAPFLIASTTLPGVSGDRPQGWSIYYFDSKVYVGTKRTVGHEFHVYDVSNPQNPIWLGSREMNHNINSIIVRDHVAYLATSGNAKDLIILDVNNPQNITIKTTLDLLGNEDGKSLYLIGNKLYLGRFKSLNNSTHSDFFVLDISNVPIENIISVLGSYNMRADINAIRVVGPYAFLATSDSEKEFSILNISSSTSIKLVNSFNLSSKSTGIDYENGAVTTSSFDPPEITRINLSPQI